MHDQVRDVKDKTDIVALIGEHVTLKKAGRHWKGLCPFHNEKSSSFVVSPELQIYKCFGCGKSGDAFTFLQEFEGLEFPDKLKVLADKAGVKLIPLKAAESGHKEVLYEVNDWAAKFYHYLLLKHTSGADALQYFTNKRGITLPTIETFLLGAAPESPQVLFNFLVSKKKVNPAVAVEAGLIYKTDRGEYVDRFRGRAIFPIQNARGATIALAGRILPGPMEHKLAKYINSPETPIYYKSESLFGLPQARTDIKKSGTAVVVEGELDMISSWQSGIKNVVAIKGSALTDAHARILSRLAKTIILALDADFAGGNAAMKGISEAQKSDLEVRVAPLGKFKDPDEFARADPSGYKQALGNAVNIWDFLIDLYFKRFSVDTAQGKHEIGQAVAPYLASIDDPIVQAHYVRLVAGRLGVPEDAVLAIVRREKRAEAPAQEVVVQKKAVESRPRRALVEERLLFLSSITGELISDESIFKTPKAQKIALKLNEFRETHKKFQVHEFFKFLPTELSDGFLDQFLEESDEPTANYVSEFKLLYKELEEMTLKQEIQEISTKITRLDTSSNDPEISALQAKIGELTKRLAQLTQ